VVYYFEKMKRITRGGITESVLRGVEIFGEISEDLICAFFDARKGIFFAESQRIKRHRETEKQNYDYRKKQEFYKLLYRLRKEGYITQTKNKKLELTEKGKNKLLSLSVLVHKKKYKKEKISYPILVVFDIPEYMRTKRDWLRNTLVALDFQMVQKSVWMGKTRIPEEFLEDIKDLLLFTYIHIFKVQEKGTLR